MAVDPTDLRDVGAAIINGCKAIDDYFYSTPAPDKALWREIFLKVKSEGPWADSNRNALASKMIEVAGRLMWEEEFALAKRVVTSPDPAREARSLRNPSNKTGCYIATAVYGSYDAEPVLVFRRFRDERLARHSFGRAFIRSYYAVSPPLAKYFEGRTPINRLAQRVLDSLAKVLDDR